MIESIFVKKLFGIFDNKINFRKEGITVIVGCNGCGKTTMLKLLTIIFSYNHRNLMNYQFDYIEVEISGHLLRIEKVDAELENKDTGSQKLRYFIDSQLQQSHEKDDRMNSPVFWSRMIPTLRRKPNGTFFDARIEEYLTLSDVIDIYLDELPEDVRDDIIEMPDAVYRLIQHADIEMISTERLKKTFREDSYRGSDSTQKFMVDECSDELRENLKNSLSEYADISQKLDEKFPSKVLHAIRSRRQKAFSEQEIKKLEENIRDINDLRIKHVKAGVLEESSDKLMDVDINPNSLDESTAVILSAYYQDMKTKLDSLNQISDRIVLFKKMIANKFGENKTIQVSKNDGITIIQKPSEKKLELKNLSSGEQQEFVLLYNLIFKGEKGKLFLIDEPEISLNVSWQRDFLEDMKAIVNINEMSILIATHSPQIINENWDLVESLGEFE